MVSDGTWYELEDGTRIKFRPPTAELLRGLPRPRVPASVRWAQAWRWARMVDSGRWILPNQHEDGWPIPGTEHAVTEEELDRIYPRDVFVSYRNALDLVRELRREEADAAR